MVLLKEPITIDRETFKALASDTRLGILKSLSERKKTVTELAESLNLSKSTVHEHLKVLVKTGLVKRINTQNKWVYYRLTWKGFGLIQNNLKKIILILSVTFISFLVGVYEVARFMFKGEPAKEAFRRTIPKIAEKGLLPVKETVEHSFPELLHPMLGLALIGVGVFLSLLLLKTYKWIWIF